MGAALEPGPACTKRTAFVINKRQLGQPDDDRQQDAGRVDETGPELDEGKIAQEREVLLEAPYPSYDDADTSVGVLQEGRHRRCAAQHRRLYTRAMGAVWTTSVLRRRQFPSLHGLHNRTVTCTWEVSF